ncbi:FecR family protein [Catenovulum sp. 2E275]|uniref:FecR family protein n=1 Tax=Catenovulum sp. 2E275 TaxID=2980497 RepID=UPI0021CF87A3|nr:FecR family protein [Catenovulum sp. 2E275]MCU4675223.1 FecR family protein [Catenovulum sp. 2E275]
MSKQTENQSEPSELELEQASIWYCKLEDATRSQQASFNQAEFENWLTQKPQHQAAFTEICQLWGALEQPVNQLLRKHEPVKLNSTHKKASRVNQITAMAACILIALTLSFAWLQDWPTRWQSDYFVQIGEKRQITTADGSEITLNSNSALAVQFTSSVRQVELLKGEAWFNVQKNPNKPFIVKTSFGDIQVTGTQFNVKVEDKQALVSLTEGSVELKQPQQSGLVKTLSPGQQAAISKQAISEVTAFDQTQVSAWLRNQFVFYNTPLNQVISHLNQYRQGQIIIVNPNLQQLKVSGVFSTKQTDKALNMICNTLALQQTRLTDYLVIIQ